MKPENKRKENLNVHMACGENIILRIIQNLETFRVGFLLTHAYQNQIHTGGRWNLVLWC